MGRWGVSFLLMLCGASLAVLIPFPDLGWGPSTTPDLAWGNGKNLYHVTPAWGTIYFLGLAYYEWRVLKGRYAANDVSLTSE